MRFERLAGCVAPRRTYDRTFLLRCFLLGIHLTMYYGTQGTEVMTE